MIKIFFLLIFFNPQTKHLSEKFFPTTSSQFAFNSSKLEFCFNDLNIFGIKLEIFLL